MKFIKCANQYINFDHIRFIRPELQAEFNKFAVTVYFCNGDPLFVGLYETEESANQYIRGLFKKSEIVEIE